MISNYKQYESIFFKSFDEKLSSIEELIVKLKVCNEDINVARDRYDENPRQFNVITGNTRLHKLNTLYNYFFKTRNEVLDIFNSIIGKKLDWW